MWAHLTECERLAGWYGEDGRIEPREGGAVWLSNAERYGVDLNNLAN